MNGIIKLKNTKNKYKRIVQHEYNKKQNKGISA
jgi:hypothetical protein